MQPFWKRHYSPENAIRDTLPKALEELGEDRAYLARLRTGLDELRCSHAV